MTKGKILTLIQETLNLEDNKEYINSLVVRSDKNHKYIKDIINIIMNSHPQKISEDEISHKLKISKRWIQKICKESFNMSYIQLLKKIHVYDALRLMYFTELDNDEISLQLNYKNYNNFSRDFKSELNLTTSEARLYLKNKRPREIVRQLIKN